MRAILIEKAEDAQSVALTNVDKAQLPDGDVLVDVAYSTLNYKDALAITGQGPVGRRFPMLPGIDFTGTVADSGHPDFKLARVQLLVLDDWGTHTLTDQQRLDLLELFEERYQRRSTIITAQLPVSGWHQMIGEPTIADAILDRIIHNAHRIELKGDSMRRKTKRADLTQETNTETMANNT